MNLDPIYSWYGVAFDLKKKMFVFPNLLVHTDGHMFLWKVTDTNDQNLQGKELIQCHAVHNKYLTLKFLLLLMEFRLSILLKDLEINRYVLYKVVIHLTYNNSFDLPVSLNSLSLELFLLLHHDKTHDEKNQAYLQFLPLAVLHQIE